MKPPRRNPPPPEPLGDKDAKSFARRKLLRLGVYVVPAILGTFAVTRSVGAATCPPLPCAPRPPGCQPFKCKPADCRPFDCDPFRECTPDCRPRG